MQVMDKCSSITHDDWQDVLVEVNRIASKPMNRYASDLPVQQRAKGAAFTLLRHIANEPVDGDIGSPRYLCGWHPFLAYQGHFTKINANCAPVLPAVCSHNCRASTVACCAFPVALLRQLCGMLLDVNGIML